MASLIRYRCEPLGGGRIERDDETKTVRISL